LTRFDAHLSVIIEQVFATRPTCGQLPEFVVDGQKEQAKLE